MTPLNQMHPSQATMRLTQIVQQAYHRRSRQLPSNLSEIVDTLKADLLKYMPDVSIETVDEAVIYEVLHDEKTLLSPSFLFSAVRKHYTPPFKARSMDEEVYTRPDTEWDTVNLLDILADNIANGRKAYFNPWREYDYLRMRGQISDDLESLYQAAKNEINVERVRDWRRPLQEWKGADLDDLNSRARHIAVVNWLVSCNEAGIKPSAVLQPLMNETQYQQLRKSV